MKLKTKTIEKIHKTKSWFLEKIYESDKTLLRFTKLKRKKTQIASIRNAIEDHYRPCRYQKDNKGIL